MRKSITLLIVVMLIGFVSASLTILGDDTDKVININKYIAPTTNGGGGTSQINVTSIRTFWAEENALLDDNSYEWSFGNGGAGSAIGIKSSRGGTIVNMSYSCITGGINEKNISIRVNGNYACSISSFSSTDTSNCDYNILPGDFMTPYTILGGGASKCVVTWDLEIAETYNIFGSGNSSWNQSFADDRYLQKQEYFNPSCNFNQRWEFLYNYKDGYGWYSSTALLGGVSFGNAPNSEKNHIGMGVMKSGTGSANGLRMYQHDRTTNLTGNVSFGGGIKVVVLGRDSYNYTARFGFYQSANKKELSLTYNSTYSPNWQLLTRTGGGAVTYYDSGLAVATGWHNFEIIMMDDMTADLYIDGIYRTSTGTISDSRTYGANIWISQPITDSSTRDLVLYDYFYEKQEFKQCEREE